MKKITLSVLLFFGFSAIVNAQLSVGVETGYNKNYLTTSTAYRSFLKYTPVAGFHIGVPVKYKLNNWFALQADPQFIKKGYKQERFEFYQGVYDEVKNSFIQVPIMANFSFGSSKLKGFLNLGGFAGYWLSSRIKGYDYSPFATYLQINGDPSTIFDTDDVSYYDEKYEFIKGKDRRLDLGLAIGLGLNYKLNKRYELFAETRYYRSMLDMQKNYMINQVHRYNDTFSIQFGCFFNLSK